MTPEEHDLLSRMDERLEFIQDKMKCVLVFKDAAAIDISALKKDTSGIPERVSRLEKWATYRDGALAILLLLVGTGRLIDFYNLLVGST